jgi:membrane-bound lytic murein transglycosylase B
LKKDVPKKYLNTSAKKINNKKKIKFFKKYIVNFEKINANNNEISAIITPDKDIVEGADDLSPAYLIFENYELILKWNRSLRFALAVCNLKDKFKNEL